MARHAAAGELTATVDAPVDAPAAASAARRADGIARATDADDAELRALLRRVVTPGAVRVAFTREPRYADGEGLAGAVDHTLVHRAGGRLETMGRLGVHRLHRNGRPCRVGYLAELRSVPDARRPVHALRDGYAELGRIAASLDGCFTSIAVDNARARRVLEHGGRLGLPAYAPLADLVTIVAPVGRDAARGGEREGEVEVDRDALTRFLDAGARAGQLAPVWDADRWTALARHGLRAGDFVVVRDGDAVVAAGAVWDQRPFRQVVVDGYAGALRVARPLVRAAAALGLAPPLPRPGAVVAQGAAFAATVADDAWWPELWRRLRARAARRGLAWLTIARDAADPQLAPLRRAARGRTYRTRLYDVRWSGSAPWPDAWDARPFRPEVGLL